MSEKHCEACRYVKRFTPRPDELKRGLVLGCNYPGYEGYTSPTVMDCGGQFFMPAIAARPAPAKETP